MRSLLRLLPLAAAGLASVATSLPVEPAPVTCEPTDLSLSPAGLELGPSETSDEPDRFFAWDDGDPVDILEDGDDEPLLVYRLRAVGEGLPECVSQLVIVTDAQGVELGRQDAPLLTESNGSARLSQDTPLWLARKPGDGEALVLTVTVGDHTRALVLDAAVDW
jgi:hypothetical protein